MKRRCSAEAENGAVEAKPSDGINRLALAQVVSWGEKNTIAAEILDRPVVPNLLHSSEDAALNDFGLSAALEHARTRKSDGYPQRRRFAPDTTRPAQPHKEKSSATGSRDEVLRQVREEAKKALKRKFSKKNIP